jgi:hypothetical protein
LSPQLSLKLSLPGPGTGLHHWLGPSERSSEGSGFFRGLTTPQALDPQRLLARRLQSLKSGQKLQVLLIVKSGRRQMKNLRPGAKIRAAHPNSFSKIVKLQLAVALRLAIATRSATLFCPCPPDLWDFPARSISVGGLGGLVPKKPRAPSQSGVTSATSFSLWRTVAAQSSGALDSGPRNRVPPKTEVVEA